MGIPKIVILEDDPNRMKLFYDKLNGKAEVIHFASHFPLVEYIKEHKDEISMFFLDHDLGGQVYVPSDDPDTGYQAALAIYSIYEGDYPSVIIHSMNPSGADNIKSLLKRAEKIPFPSLIRGI